jgi:hypothetical protein
MGGGWHWVVLVFVEAAMGLQCGSDEHWLGGMRQPITLGHVLHSAGGI